MELSSQNPQDYLISVILPVYNVEKYIEECLQSLAKQNDNNYEVIVIDDGSKDNSIALAEGFIDKIQNFKIIHQENKGLGGARNTGIDAANGSFIIFVDSDDYVSQDFLKILRKEQINGDYDVVCGKFQKISEKGVKILVDSNNRIIDCFNLAHYQKALGLFESSVAWAKLIRKDILLRYNIRFLKRIPHEDWFFTYKVLMLCKSASSINDKIYYYRQREGSLGKSISLVHINILPHLRLDTISFLKKYKADENDFDLAARRILIVIKVFRHMIKISGDAILSSFYELLLRNMKDFENDLYRFKKSGINDENIAKTANSILKEAIDYKLKSGKTTDTSKKDLKHELKLSIITPSYNQVTYVQSMIKSVVEQSSAPFEHIILDAGSKDGTIDILKSYENSNSFVTLHVGCDVSQTNAINLGFCESRGDIITWLNTDDKYYSTDVLRKVMDVFNAHPDVDIVYGRGNFIDNLGTFIREVFVHKDSSQVKNKFIRSVGIIQPALFFRRRVLDKIGLLNESLNYSFDYEYWIRMAINGMKFYFFNEIVCEAVLHQDSKTIGQRNVQLLETIQVAMNYYNFASAEWLNKLADNILTGADGITTNTNQKTIDHQSKVNELFLEYNSNRKAVSAIWSLSPHEDVKNSLDLLKATVNRFNFYLATAMDLDCFQQGLTLIAQLQKTSGLEFAILVYDLGLSGDQKNILYGLSNVFVISPLLNGQGFPAHHLTLASHTYRAYISWHAGCILPSGSCFMFVDAGAVPVRNIQSLTDSIMSKDIFLLKCNTGLRTERHLVLPYTSDECIKAMGVNRKELLSPLLNDDLFGYKTGGKYKKLFDNAYEYFINDSFNNVVGKNSQSIPADLSLAQIKQKILDEHFIPDDIEFSTIRQAFGLSTIDCFQSLLSILASRYNAPVEKENNIYILHPLAHKTPFASVNKLPSGIIPDFELNNHLIPENAFFLRHLGHFINYQGLIFDLKKKKRAIVMGNGPSLRGFDFNRLKDFDVFGMNAAYRFWDRINWYPQYFSCLDVVVGLSHAEEIKRLIENAEEYGIKRFLLLDNLIRELNLSKNHERVINFDLLHKGYESLAAPNITTGSHTTAWAASLGYEEIYLIGIDSIYVEVIEGAKHVKGIVLQMETTPSTNPNYFFDDYQQRGDVYHIPNPTRPVHFQGWREISGRLQTVDVKILNTNLLSGVDAFNFCHFCEIENGNAIEILTRERVAINNFLINSLKKNIKKDNKICKLVLLFKGRIDGFNLKAFLNEEWQVWGLVMDKSHLENLIIRYGLELVDQNIPELNINLHQMIDNQNDEKFQVVTPSKTNGSQDNLSNHADSSIDSYDSVDYLYIGSDSKIAQTESILHKLKPRIIEIYFEDKTGNNMRNNILNIADGLKLLGYSIYLLIWKDFKNNIYDFIFLSSEEDLSGTIEKCCMYACTEALDLDKLQEQISNLDVHHLYLIQKYGFSFVNIYKSESVEELNGRFKLSPPGEKNYLTFRYYGRIRFEDQIKGSITFTANSSANLKLMLCRDGNTPFEHGEKKITIEPGKHTLEIEHKFSFSHTGVRIQLGVESGILDISEISTRILVRRDGKVMEIDGYNSISRMTLKQKKVIIEKSASDTRRLGEYFYRNLYIAYRKAVELFFPESTRRRLYAGLLKKNIVLFIIWVRYIFSKN